MCLTESGMHLDTSVLRDIPSTLSDGHMVFPIVRHRYVERMSTDCCQPWSQRTANPAPSFTVIRRSRLRKDIGEARRDMRRHGTSLGWPHNGVDSQHNSNSKRTVSCADRFLAPSLPPSLQLPYGSPVQERATEQGTSVRHRHPCGCTVVFAHPFFSVSKPLTLHHPALSSFLPLGHPDPFPYPGWRRRKRRQNAFLASAANIMRELSNARLGWPPLRTYLWERGGY